MKSVRYIAIEGNIGSGKTTLAKRLASHLGASLILEEFAHNPLLPAFYTEPQRYAFHLELSFLADRCEQLRAVSETPPFIISDYLLEKSLVFSEVNLKHDDFQLYCRIFNQMSRGIMQPDLIIFLSSDSETLKMNIRERGRSYEQNIQAEYLQNISDLYDVHLKTLTIPILQLSTNEWAAKKDEDQFDSFLARFKTIIEKMPTNASRQ